MTIVKPIDFTPEGPQPLVRHIPRGAHYPVADLGPLRAVVEAVQATTQAPVAIAAQSALSVASLAVQGFADVETLGGPAPVSLFCLTIAESGERKSGCDKLVMAGLKRHERDQAEEYRLAMASYVSAHKLWTAKRDRMVKEAAGSNKVKAVAAEADLEVMDAEPQPPISPKVTTSEPTLEGLFKLYLTGQPSLGLFSDEGGGFLGGHAMNTDNKLKTVAGLSSLWGGEGLDRVRAGDGAFTLHGRRLAAHLMVQPVAAQPLLSDPVASGQGFLARFLITQPPSAIGTRLNRDNGGQEAKEAIEAMGAKLVGILSSPKPTCEDIPQELMPRTLPLSSKAKEILRRYYETTEREQAPGGQLEYIRSFASKSPEQAARIAGVLTLWADVNATEVEAATMAQGVEIAQFHLGEAKRLAEAATITEDIARADNLRVWIGESWPAKAQSLGLNPLTILPKYVVDHGPNSLRETATVKRLMAILADHGWLHPLEPMAEVDGAARKLAYRVEVI
ncbi:YfjI family protein [uncultured Litoreibacter sp.]|uniref:YfjI family protein n=1 Tax=uncultured Litoreibacter sp. TaxID=1392394 RepID=UPI0026018E3D|nr:YfjI family protein [uncultured Litoreibacter sp.]